MNTKQHRTSTTYTHVVNVAILSYIINKQFNLDQNIEDLIAGAYLHDYFLYDWRDKAKRIDKFKHGFKHPDIAMDNATKDFKINNKVRNIIYQHMWPYTITKIPKYREQFIVQLADKICAIEEIFGITRRHIKVENTNQVVDIFEYIQKC